MTTARFRTFARGRTARRAPGTMNKSEAAYAVTLTARRAVGEIVEFWYEGMTLKWAKDTRWTPDFMVMLPDGLIELHECKGFMEDHAFVKLKTCAALFPFRVLLVKPVAKKHGGGWEITEVGSAAPAAERIGVA